MKLGYTEFSFGYAFTENLIRSMATGPTGAPYFPNLIQEGSLGFDVRIDLPACPIFFQYKLPELMKKSSAKEIATYHLAGIQVRFFRMSLMRRNTSHQHRLLIDWEARYPSKVFYATPCLHDVGEFNTAYNAAGVHRRSAFFSPQDIGPLPDDKAHTIAYRPGLAFGYFCSDPRKIPARTFEDVEKTLLKAFGQTRFARLELASEELRKQVLEQAPRQLRQSEGAIRERIRARRVTVGVPEPAPEAREAVENILVAREIARVGLGLDLLMAQPRDEADGAQGA